MSLPTDLSLMDFLLEREDPVLSLEDKDTFSRSDQKDTEGMAVSYSSCENENYFEGSYSELRFFSVISIGGRLANKSR